VRKTRSRFGARLEPMSHVRLLLYRSRAAIAFSHAGGNASALDIVSQAESVEPLSPMLASLDRASQGMAVLEAADQLALEREANPRLYEMLVGALRTLAARDAPLVVPGFLLKALALEGYRPQVESCGACGEAGPLVSWAMEEGGLRCAAHRQGPAVSRDAVLVLQHMLGGRLSAALDETRPPVVSEVDHLVVRAFEHHVERRLRSVGTFDRG
jgi:DNA repair protein RecO (recombination protein O)